MLERIQKIIADSGRCSRRAAEELIAAGLVTVNGQVAELGARANRATDAIKVEGKLLAKPSARRYLLLNKPKGVVTTTDDPEGRTTVIDLVRRQVSDRVYPVGRLDVQTEGLLILTNDGSFALKVMHPSYGCAKEYHAKVKGALPEKTLVRLRRGIRLDDRRTAPAEIEFLRASRARGTEATGNGWYRIVLREGKNQQVRRMFEAVGHPVLKLRRVAIGPIRDDRLEPGAWRELEPKEIHALLRPKR